jgi:hypothetical protein
MYTFFFIKQASYLKDSPIEKFSNFNNNHHIEQVVDENAFEKEPNDLYASVRIKNLTKVKIHALKKTLIQKPKSFNV